VIIDCDGAEDCEAGTVCRYSLGESEYFRCSTANTGYGAPCSEAADCPSAFPTCRFILDDDRILGFRPGFCAS
jgi:hypothetical protein